METQALTLSSPDATAEFANQLGACVRPGDTLLLDGPVGAGKSHFARALIQSLQEIREDIPSPTFTLVQTYATQAGEIWHCDLYRLSDIEELVELGLTEAFASSICLIEWPDRLGHLSPPGALRLSLSPIDADPNVRTLTLHMTTEWAQRLLDFAA